MTVEAPKTLNLEEAETIPILSLFVQSANENENKDAAMTMNGGGH